MIDTTKHYLEVAEAADILNVSPATVRRLFDAGLLRGFRLPMGNHRRISSESVFAFANQQTAPEREQRSEA